MAMPWKKKEPRVIINEDNFTENRDRINLRSRTKSVIFFPHSKLLSSHCLDLQTTEEEMGGRRRCINGL